MVKSLMDYLGRWLALKFLPRERAEQFHNKELVEMAYREGTKSKDAFAMRLPVVDEGTQVKADDFETVLEEKNAGESREASEKAGVVETKLQIARQQGFTGAMCGNCGSLRVKANGSCEVCLDCGATSGCS